MKILSLEDDVAFTALLKATLEGEGLEFTLEHVETREAFLTAIRTGDLDLILADYSLPGFDGLSALALARVEAPDVPFLFVSGSLGEEIAIESLKNGATDYVLKHRLARLFPAVQRALREAAGRRERVRAERVIREQARLIDLAPDAIMVCDLNGVLGFWNHGAEELYGWKAAEVAGRPPTERMCRNAVGFAEALRRVRQTGSWRGQWRQITRDQREVIVSSRWTLLHDGQERPESVLMIDTDMTDAKQMEARFLRAQRLEGIGTLASGIAHDLNNVLTPITLSVSALREEGLKAEALELVDTIEGCAQRGATLLRQLLTFARGAEGERGPLHIKHVIHELDRMIAETFPKDIRHRHEVAEDVWAVNADATQLHQVLLNLSINARDAMPRGGTLTLAAANQIVDATYAGLTDGIAPGPFVVVSVADTGAGIPEEIQAKIFDPFFTTKDPGKGTGLGLSTARGIVKSHGGFMTLHSSPGQGTTFRVFLPAVADTARVDRHTSRFTPRAGQGERVLVVDDEAPVREVTCRTLRDHGYEAVAAEDGYRGLAIVGQSGGTVRAVVTDIAMQNMDGSTFVRALKGIDSQVPVIVISGLMQREKVESLKQSGVFQFLEKPFTAGQLLEALDAALRAQGDPGKK